MYQVVADRPMCRVYFTGWVDGIPVSSMFEADAARMTRAVADRMRDRVSEWFYGYYVRYGGVE